MSCLEEIRESRGHENGGTSLDADCNKGEMKGKKKTHPKHGRGNESAVASGELLGEIGREEGPE